MAKSQTPPRPRALPNLRLFIYGLKGFTIFRGPFVSEFVLGFCFFIGFTYFYVVWALWGFRHIAVIFGVSNIYFFSCIVSVKDLRSETLPGGRGPLELLRVQRSQQKQPLHFKFLS